MRTKDKNLLNDIELFIDDYIQNCNRSPSIREIASNFGIAASTVSRYLSALRETGAIEYSGHRNITTKKQRTSSLPNLCVPILGSVSCGIPKLAEENIEEYVTLPTSIFGKGDFYLLRANGESMIEAGIDDSDLVLIRRQDYAEVGDIVVALIDNDEATLKRYIPDPVNHRIILHPENHLLDDIIVRDCIIQGIAVHVLKDLQKLPF